MISVVIPSLNQGAFIEQAVESVLRQSYPRVELIVMDGGSTDGTTQVLKKYEGSLAYWRSARDDGPAAALNDGFAQATGDLFGVLNADDFYLPDALLKVANAFAMNPSVDVVSGHGRFARPNGDLGVLAYSDRWSITRFRYGACVLVQPATFFRRAAFERVGGFRRSGRVCWDMELWNDLSHSGSHFHLIDEVVAAFRLHDASITGREDLLECRRRDAREVMSEARGRPESRTDRAMHVLFRSIKFAGHPLRTIRQRSFFRSVLKRWSL